VGKHGRLRDTETSVDLNSAVNDLNKKQLSVSSRNHK
jgi:hypothetical protein